MEIITGYRGEAHITSAQDRKINQGAFGSGSYILDVGRVLEAEIVTANEIRIYDGALVLQGCAADIQTGTYDALEIASGTQGMNRADLICARYTKDAGTNVENMALVVITGTPTAGEPTTPACNTGNIADGDSPVDFPLYQVNVVGVSIDSVTRLATVADNIGAIAASVEAATRVVTGSGTGSNQYVGIEYSYTQIGKVVTLTFKATPTQNISGSTSGVTLPNIPVPVGDIYGTTHTNTTGSTVYGAARLISGVQAQIALYGARTGGTAYYGSFTYITA